MNFCHAKQHFGRRKGRGMKAKFRKGEGRDKYLGKGIFDVNEGSNYKVETQTNFVTLFCDEN